MTPESEKDLLGTVDCLCAQVEIQQTQIDILVEMFEHVWRQGFSPLPLYPDSTRDYVHKETVRRVNERLRNLADEFPRHASTLKDFLDKYEKS